MRKPTEANDSKEDNAQKEVRSSRLRTGLLIAGSALFGGIAVAFWNRRTLTKMQNPPAEKASAPPSVDEDAIY